MKIKGILLASFASSLWAISGVSGEILFKEFNFSTNWVVSVRTLIAGILLLVISKFIEKKDIFLIFKNKNDTFQLLLFGTIGMYLVQSTYFKTIELSNVSFATILQFTAPFFIFIYETIKNKKIPSIFTIILLLTTALGVDLIATKGKFSNLSWSIEVVLIGLLSAMMIAFYSLQPKKLLRKYGSLTVTGWGMLIGSCLANIIHPFWEIGGELTKMAIIQMIIIVIFGTAMAYLMYISSLNYISSSLAGILTAFEPVLATILSVVLFKLSFSPFEILGFVLVFVSIIILQKRL